jgi:glycosyltransferase involved in cell wall biosynthesis
MTENETFHRAKVRTPIGVWAQWGEGVKWSNEGMIRLLGFLIEGVVQDQQYMYRIVVPDWVRVEAEQDLRSLNARLGVDFTIHSPADHGMRGGRMADLVDFANEYVDVEGWISIFPFFDLAVGLEKPLTVVFPDAITNVFHEFSEAAWGFKGSHTELEKKMRRSLGRADRVITFSKHVRDNQLATIFQFPPDKVSVVPHAPPDIAEALPFVEGRQRTAETAARAAAILRDHAAVKGWDYLRNFPFEQLPFVAVSTQDRVTKNIALVLEAVLRLVREQRRDLKIFTTAPLHFGANWTALPGTIEHRQAHRDLVSVRDLPRREHAALMHCASLVVHASLFEGGHAPFPFYEAVSVGTPCLMAMGPHMTELLEEVPELAPFTFRPNDREGLAALIVETLERRDEVVSIQQQVFERLRRRSWADVSAAYAAAAMEASSARRRSIGARKEREGDGTYPRRRAAK